VHVPRFKQFSVRKLLQWSIADQTLRHYLPDFDDLEMEDPAFTIAKEFLFNLVATLKPDFWSRQIEDALQQRKEKQALKEQQQIEITEDFYNLLMGSKHLSTGSRGRALGQLAAGHVHKPRASKQKPARNMDSSPSGLRTAPTSHQKMRGSLQNSGLSI
jgi:hypothetical protein